MDKFSVYWFQSLTLGGVISCGHIWLITARSVQGSKDAEATGFRPVKAEARLASGDDADAEYAGEMSTYYWVGVTNTKS